MKTYVASIGGNAVLALRAEDDEKARAMIDDHEGGMRSDLKALRTESRYGTESLPFRRKRRRRHTMPNVSSLGTKQSATRKSTWRLATTPMSGASI